jgi:hypothetical protein
LFEQVNRPGIMSPWEVRCHIAFLQEHLAPDQPVKAAFDRLEKFAAGWTAAWARFGGSETGLPFYRQLLARAEQDLLLNRSAEVKLRNEVPLSLALSELIFKVALPGPPVNKPLAASMPQLGQRLAS